MFEILLRPNPLTGWYDLPLHTEFRAKNEWTLEDESSSFCIETVGNGTVEVRSLVASVTAEELSSTPEIIPIMQDAVPGKICVFAKEKELSLWYCLRVAEGGINEDFLEKFLEDLTVLTSEGEEKQHGVIDLDYIEKQLKDGSDSDEIHDQQ